MSTYTKERALTDYTTEVAYFTSLKKEGVSQVKDNVIYSPDDDMYRDTLIPIDEAITFWANKLELIKALPDGADAEEFNY